MNTDDGTVAVRLHAELTEALASKGEFAAEIARMAITTLGDAGWLERLDLVGGLEKLELAPDDVVVVRLAQPMAVPSIERMAADCERVTGHRVVIVVGATTIMTARTFAQQFASQPTPAVP